MASRIVSLHQTLVGSQMDVVTFLPRAANACTRNQTGQAEGGADDEVRSAVAARLQWTKAGQFAAS